MRRSLVLFAFLCCAAPASALTVDDESLAWDLSGVGLINVLTGTVDFLGMTTGLPVGGTVLDGVVDPGDITLTFSVSIDPASDFFLPNFELFALGPDISAVGSLPGGDVGFMSASQAPVVGDWIFDGQLDPGETTAPLFVSFETLPVGTQLQFETVFGLLGSVLVVPEPGTTLLWCVGLLGIAASRRL